MCARTNHLSYPGPALTLSPRVIGRCARYELFTLYPLFYARCIKHVVYINFAMKEINMSHSEISSHLVVIISVAFRFIIAS